MKAFPPPFRTLLDEILRRAPRMRAARDLRERARRRVRAQTGTFAGHRAYSDGDDLRQLDWNVFARTGELFLKVLEEEEGRSLTLCLDTSPSMATGEPERLCGARRLAAILGGLALVRLDALHLVTGRGESHTLQGAVAVPGLLELLEGLVPGPGEPLDLVQEPLQAGWLGTLCWISDFAEPERAAPALTLLRRHGRTCRGFLPMLQGDREPDLGGWLRLVDPETGREEVVQIDAALRAAMKQELHRLGRQQASIFAAVGYPLIRFDLPAEGDFRLSSWFDGGWISRI